MVLNAQAVNRVTIIYCWMTASTCVTAENISLKQNSALLKNSPLTPTEQQTILLDTVCNTRSKMLHYLN